MIFACEVTSAASAWPLANAPAAKPATVASAWNGKTLLVPTASGTSGAPLQPVATSRWVPSPAERNDRPGAHVTKLCGSQLRVTAGVPAMRFGDLHRSRHFQARQCTLPQPCPVPADQHTFGPALDRTHDGAPYRTRS